MKKNKILSINKMLKQSRHVTQHWNRKRKGMAALSTWTRRFGTMEGESRGSKSPWGRATKKITGGLNKAPKKKNALCRDTSEERRSL